jgi:hypothetical protein
MHDMTTPQLSDYVDGELTATASAAVEAHLAQCAECRTVVEQLRGIAAAAGALPGTLPAANLWPGIESRIARPSALVPARPVETVEDMTRRRRVTFTLPQLAAAAVLLMLLSGGIVFLVRPAGAPAETRLADAMPPLADGIVPATLAEASFENAVADLERILAAGRGRLDPDTVRVLQQNLATIDVAIEQSRQALEADPANAFLNSHLVSARQRKIALLRRATALTTGS